MFVVTAAEAGGIRRMVLLSPQDVGTRPDGFHSNTAFR